MAFFGVSRSGGAAAANTVLGPGPTPGSSTDNALARFNGTTGILIQNSVAILDDTGNLSGLFSLEVNQNPTNNARAAVVASGSLPTALLFVSDETTDTNNPNCFIHAGDNASCSGFEFDIASARSTGASPDFSSPDYLDANDGLFNLFCSTFEGTFFNDTIAAAIRIRASEDHGPGALGTKIQFQTTPVGTASRVATLIMQGTQNLLLNGSAAAPSIAGQNFVDSGFFFVNSGGTEVHVASGGVDVGSFVANGNDRRFRAASNAATFIEFNYVNDGRMRLSAHTTGYLETDGIGAASWDNTAFEIDLALAILDTSVTITADNQSVTTTGISCLELDSNNATPANRTFTLTNGRNGQMLMLIAVSATNGLELLDTGNCLLAGAWSISGANQGSTLSLKWVTGLNKWVELARSIN